MSGDRMARRLPALEGVSLAGRSIRFPDELPAAGLVLVFGFTHAARHDVGAWKAALRGGGIPFLSLPTAATDTTAEALAGVAQAMRSHVPEDGWEDVVQIHRGGEMLLREFFWRGDAFAKLLRVSHGGWLVARHDEGPFSPAALEAFLG